MVKLIKFSYTIALMSVVFAPEVMHGMGFVYWHQSVLQATLPAQMLAYYLWKSKGSKYAKSTKCCSFKAFSAKGRI